MVQDALKRELGEECVKGTITVKDNGVKREGIHLVLPDNKLAPIVYLDSSKGIYNDSDIDAFVGWALKTYRNAAKYTGKGISGLGDWDVVKDYIKIRLLNGERNLKQLKDFFPYIKIMDLVATFDISSEKVLPEYGDGKIRITNFMMDTWNVDVDTLYKVAIQNMEREGYEFDDVRKYLGILLNDENTDYDKAKPSLYILRVYDGVYGACAMLSKKIMDKVCENFSSDSVYILPSSVHEVIVITAEDMDVVALKNMVYEINEAIVGAEEYLADNVYQYSANLHELKIANIEKVVNVA